VLDAMPVERFRLTGAGAEIFHVGWDGEGFEWRPQRASEPGLAEAIGRIAKECGLPAGYVSELGTAIAPWVRSAAGTLERGLLLLIDYGYPRSEYYHAQHSSGTLLCHYRHRAHANPLLWPGLQDMTAHVDFTAVAEAADASGLDVAGYTTQAHFLLDCGLETLLQAQGDPASIGYLKAAQQAKTLIMPGEMGERFKAIALARGLDGPLPGFRLQDMRYRL